MCGRDRTESPCLEIFECLHQFGAGVHHEWSVCGNRLADGLAAKDEHIKSGGSRVLLSVCGHRECLALPQHRKLAALQGPACITCAY